MQAIEKDLIAWTKARLRLDAYVLDNRPCGTWEHAKLNGAEAKARLPLIRRGMRLLRKEGKADAR